MEEAVLKISQKLIDLIEDYGVRLLGTYHQDKSYFTELGYYSDLGEDFIINLWHDNNDESFIKSLESYYNDFDPEEHAAMWYEARNDVQGVPQSLRALLDDADRIDETLENLVIECRKAA